MSEGFDQELLSEEEVEGLKFTPSESDEPGPTPEEKVEEPSPPAEEKVEAKPEESPPEPPSEEKKVPIDGILTKDGKNFIPFNVLEEERHKRQEAETERQRLLAEIEELRKPKEPPKPEEKKVEPEVEPDFKALASKAYESEDGMAEVLKHVHEAGIRAGEKKAVEAATSTATSVTMAEKFQDKVNQIRKDNPWLTPEMEDMIAPIGIRLIKDRKIAPADIAGYLKTADDAIVEAKKIFRIDEPKVDIEAEKEKWVKEGMKIGTEALMKKLNIKEEPRTLSDVRNLNPDVFSKLDEINKLEGLDFEEALGQLTPEEREAIRSRLP